MIGPDGFAELLHSAGATPYLDHAACRGEASMADLTDKSPEDALERAEAVCHRCPARAACIAWIDGLAPHLRPAGHVAGELLGPPPAPPRRKRDPADDGTWLAKFLRARSRSAPAEQVVAAAAAAGIPASRLRRVRSRCGVTVSTGAAAGPVWVLDDDEPAVAS